MSNLTKKQRQVLIDIRDDPERPWLKNEIADELREKGYIMSWPQYTNRGQRYVHQITMRGQSALTR